jgi:hypothetical protein
MRPALWYHSRKQEANDKPIGYESSLFREDAEEEISRRVELSKKKKA